MKKQIFAAALSCTALFALASVASADQTLYSLDGRVADFPDEVIEQMYAESGRLYGTQWYDFPVAAEYHHATVMYAPDDADHPDGRTEVFIDEEVEAQKAVGWYDYKVKTVYSPEDTKVVVANTDLQAWLDEGWYSYPVVYIDFYDGARCVIAEKDMFDWDGEGWKCHELISKGWTFAGWKNFNVEDFDTSAYHDQRDWNRYYFMKNADLDIIDHDRINYNLYAVCPIYNEKGDRIWVKADNVSLNWTSNGWHCDDREFFYNFGPNVKTVTIEELNNMLEAYDINHLAWPYDEVNRKYVFDYDYSTYLMVPYNGDWYVRVSHDDEHTFHFVKIDGSLFVD